MATPKMIRMQKEDEDRADREAGDRMCTSPDSILQHKLEEPPVASLQGSCVAQKEARAHPLGNRVKERIMQLERSGSRAHVQAQYVRNTLPAKPEAEALRSALQQGLGAHCKELAASQAMVRAQELAASQALLRAQDGELAALRAANRELLVEREGCARELQREKLEAEAQLAALQQRLDVHHEELAASQVMVSARDSEVLELRASYQELLARHQTCVRQFQWRRPEADAQLAGLRQGLKPHGQELASSHVVVRTREGEFPASQASQQEILAERSPRPGESRRRRAEAEAWPQEEPRAAEARSQRASAERGRGLASVSGQLPQLEERLAQCITKMRRAGEAAATAAQLTSPARCRAETDSACCFFTVHGADYALLAARPTVLAGLRLALQEAIAEEVGSGLSPLDLTLQLWEGSSVVWAAAQPPPGTKSASIDSVLRLSTKFTKVAPERLSQVEGIDGVQTGPLLVRVKTPSHSTISGWQAAGLLDGIQITLSGEAPRLVAAAGGPGPAETDGSAGSPSRA